MPDEKFDLEKHKKGNDPLVFLDIDIDGAQEAFQRAKDFVTTTNLRYSLTSNWLHELGGAEIARLPDLYESDYEWAQRGPMITSMPPQRMVIKCFAKPSPLAVKNFVSLAHGKGMGKSGKPLHYKGVPFHRVLSGMLIQGGDLIHGNGSGGESIYNGKKFKDDKSGLKLKLEKRGLVAMCNNGKNSNSSQFFFTFAPCEKLNGKHVVFGEIIYGFEVLDLIEKVEVKDEKPVVPIIIKDCGVLHNGSIRI